MSNNVTAISFDKRTFRFSPYTQHQNVEYGENVTFMLYDDAHTPKRGNNLVKLEDEFKAAARNTTTPSVLYVALSGLKADPNIDFTLEGKSISIRAIDYLNGYGDYLSTIPEEEALKLQQDPHALDHYDQEWSIAYFKKELSSLLEGPDEFFCIVFRGIDNAMGDIQRSMILYSQDDLYKEHHGSFDLGSQGEAIVKRDI